MNSAPGLVIDLLDSPEEGREGQNDDGGTEDDRRVPRLSPESCCECAPGHMGKEDRDALLRSVIVRIDIGRRNAACSEREEKSQHDDYVG